MTCSGSSSRHKRYPCLSNLLFPSSVFPQIIAVSKKLNHNPAVIIPPPFPPHLPVSLLFQAGARASCYLAGRTHRWKIPGKIKEQHGTGNGMQLLWPSSPAASLC